MSRRRPNSRTPRYHRGDRRRRRQPDHRRIGWPYLCRTAVNTEPVGATRLRRTAHERIRKAEAANPPASRSTRRRVKNRPRLPGDGPLAPYTDPTSLPTIGRWRQQHRAGDQIGRRARHPRPAGPLPAPLRRQAHVATAAAHHRSRQETRHAGRRRHLGSTTGHLRHRGTGGDHQGAGDQASVSRSRPRATLSRSLDRSAPHPIGTRGCRHLRGVGRAGTSGASSPPVRDRAYRVDSRRRPPIPSAGGRPDPTGLTGRA